LGDVNYNISKLTIHADKIKTDSPVNTPPTIIEDIKSNFTVTAVNDGNSYPTNGRIGTNPTVNITNINKITVNGFTLTTNDSNFDSVFLKENRKWKVTISPDGVVSTETIDDGVVSTYEPVSCTFRSIGDAIVLKATFSINGDYSNEGDKTLHATTTIDFNDDTTTIFNKVQHENITVTTVNSSDNLTLTDV
jgi:hypothetical protein